MTSVKFKQLVRDHIENQKLSQQQLSSLQELGTKYQADHEKETPKKWAVTLGITASFMLLLFVHTTYNNINREKLITATSHELALNHLKLKPLDISTSAFTQLQRYFTQLDFVPSQSHLTERLKLIGGRYCSVSGITAAQLRYINEESQLTTVYQVPYNKEDFYWVPEVGKDDAPLKRSANGLHIRFWREKGLVFASVKP